MKKLYTLTIASALALSLGGCATSTGSSSVTPSSSVKLDQKEVCNVAKLGVEQVLANAKAYNAVAKKEGVEFRRLGVNNSAYIDAVEKALKDGSKTVTLIDIKKKPTKDNFTVEYAAHRACSFGLSALQQEEEAKSTWRLAIPGDGFKY